MWMYEPKDKCSVPRFPIHSNDSLLAGVSIQDFIDVYNANGVKDMKSVRMQFKECVKLNAGNAVEIYKLCEKRILEELQKE